VNEALVKYLTPEHLLIIGIAYLFYRWLKRTQSEARDEHIKAEQGRHQAAKDEIRAALGNGIGDMMKKLNAEQDARWLAAMRQEFVAHEHREEEQTQKAIANAGAYTKEAVDRVLRKMEEHDARLVRLEERLIEARSFRGGRR